MTTTPQEASSHISLVTGANTGIGKEIAKGLARAGGTVVLGCRSVEKGQAAREEIVRETGNARVEVMQVDMSSMASVRAFADAFARAHSRLDVLVNNAGMWQVKHQVTAEGFEITWATNVLGLHLLTQCLAPLLERSAPSRVINTTSMMAKGLDLSDVNFERRPFDGQKSYGATKQAVTMLTLSQAEKFKDRGITANAVDPGMVGGTEALRNVGGVAKVVFPILAKLFGKSPAQGADTSLWLATAPEAAQVTGKVFSNRKPLPPKFDEPTARQSLWELCERMTASSGPVNARP